MDITNAFAEADIYDWIKSNYFKVSFRNARINSFKK